MKIFFTRMLVVLLAVATLSSNAFALGFAKPVTSGTDPDAATVQTALKDFNSLSGKEKKERFKEVKKALKDFKAQKKVGKEPVASTVLQVIFAILLPPLGVYLHEGVINSKFWIDLVLTLLFYLPGMIYALIVVLGE